MKRKSLEELISTTKRFKSDKNHKISTKLIHSGQEPDKYSGAVMIPITLSSTFAQTEVGVKYEGGYEYSRSGNPTRNALEECVASVEGGEYGFAFASGLGGTTAITHLLKSGDEVICFDDVYGGTGRYFRIAQEKMGIKVHFVDLNKKGALEEAINEKTKMVWIETPSNPTLKIVDIEATAKVCKKNKIMLAVDNTFMSPYFQQPLKLGADIVFYSATKYMNGHSDVVMGLAVTSDKEIHDKLRYLQNALGITPSPFDCFMVLRGLKTLHIRMERHEKNAKVIAEFLEKHDKVLKVTYPGLKSHPQHELAKKQMKGFGGMITFYLKGGLEESNQFLSTLKIFTLAESLGGVESLAEHPALMTHASVPEKLRNELGIKDNMVRLSVGIEDVDDLLNDIKNGLDAIKKE